MWACAVMVIVLGIACVFASSVAYDHGVWDGINNPTIPAVRAALDRLHRRGWR